MIQNQILKYFLKKQRKYLGKEEQALIFLQWREKEGERVYIERETKNRFCFQLHSRLNFKSSEGFKAVI